MFTNPGGKLKGLALLTFWAICLITTILGLKMMVEYEEMAFNGLLIIILGFLSAWLSSISLYSYGQMVQNTDKLVDLVKSLTKEKDYSNNSVEKFINKDFEEKSDANESKKVIVEEKETISEGYWKCMGCGKHIPLDIEKCECGYKKQ